MNFLEDPFIKSLVARLIEPGVVGLALVGSYARGQNTSNSDVIENTLQLVNHYEESQSARHQDP